MKDDNIYKTIAYCFVNASNEVLTLQGGYFKNEDGKVTLKSFWSFIGNNIPMPVRSGTWFEGMKFKVMRSWLESNGWHLYSAFSFVLGEFVLFPDSSSTFLNERDEKALNQYGRKVMPNNE